MVEINCNSQSFIHLLRAYYAFSNYTTQLVCLLFSYCFNAEVQMELFILKLNVTHYKQQQQR